MLNVGPVQIAGLWLPSSPASVAQLFWRRCPPPERGENGRKPWGPLQVPLPLRLGWRPPGCSRGGGLHPPRRRGERGWQRPARGQRGAEQLKKPDFFFLWLIKYEPRFFLPWRFHRMPRLETPLLTSSDPKTLQGGRWSRISRPGSHPTPANPPRAGGRKAPPLSPPPQPGRVWEPSRPGVRPLIGDWG